MKTETRNAKFKAATASQRRVMIARDVIALMKAKKFKPKTGAFVRMKFSKGRIPDSQSEVCELVSDAAPRVNCECCALGAMMVSEIRHNNALRVGAAYFDSDDGTLEIVHEGAGDRLKNYFPKEQLKLIEIAFESGRGYYTSQAYTGSPFKDEDHAASALFKNETPTQRMTAIMRNIIANDGTFIPTKKN